MPKIKSNQVFGNGVEIQDVSKITTDQATIGDAGTEGAGITIDGVTYQSSLKVSDIGGTNKAQNVMHRHSTTLEPLILGARSNSNTSSHSAITAGQNVFSIYGAGYAGTDYKLFGQVAIGADTTGTISDTSAPGKLEFKVTPDGSVTPATFLTINNAGKATFAEGVDFTPGKTVNLDGINYFDLATEETGGGTTSDTSGVTFYEYKFNFNDSVLYSTGFGFFGYEPSTGTYSADSPNLYFAAENGINFFANDNLAFRINDDTSAFFKGDVDFEEEVNFTAGKSVRLRGKNYISLGTNEEGGSTTSDTYGITVDSAKFNFADSVLYKTGFGFQGYDDYDDSYSAFARNAYIAGDDGINLFTNSNLRLRIRENGEIKLTGELQANAGANFGSSEDPYNSKSITVAERIEIGEANSGVPHYLDFWDPGASTQARLRIGILSDRSTYIGNTASTLMKFYNNQGDYEITGHNGTTGTTPIKLKSVTPSAIIAAPKAAVANGDMTSINTSGKEAGSASMYLDETNNKLKFKVLYSDGTTFKTGEIALT